MGRIAKKYVFGLRLVLPEVACLKQALLLDISRDEQRLLIILPSNCNVGTDVSGELPFVVWQVYIHQELRCEPARF